MRNPLLTILLILAAGAAYGRETITKTFYFPEEWSGEWKNFSQWYTFTTPEAPAGYEVADVKYELQGDRLCHSRGECREVKRHPNGSVTLQFWMQGHDENFRLQLDRIDKKRCDL
jgi:hypothetical protein